MAAAGKPLKIAVIVDLNAHYTRSVCMGIRQYIRAHQGIVCDMISSEKGLWEWIEQGEWDGVIADASGDDFLAGLSKCKLPSVNLSNAEPPDELVPRVVTDDYAVGQMAAEHLLERGIRHFAFFGMRDVYVSHLRKQGYVEALAKAGFDCEILLPNFQLTKGRWINAEIPGMEERVRNGCCPLGVFCMNDGYARHVIGCCASHDISVPEQVAVLGVDNSEMADGLAELPFSSVELQTRKIGYMAVELLQELIRGKRPPKKPLLVAPKQVVVRASTDLLAIDDQVVVRGLRLIREKAYEPLQIEDIVRSVGLSRRMFEKRFKSSVGRAPYAEVIRLRIEKAKMLLADTELRISEVAEQSGFGQAKQLHGIFIREVQLTPSAFRRKFQRPR